MAREPIDRLRIGLDAESRAAELLTAAGLVIVVRNYRCRSGELDLVARSDRLLVIAEALRLGMSHAEIHRITHYDPWFIAQLQRIVDAECWVKEHGLPEDAASLTHLKSLGFSDKQLARLAKAVIPGLSRDPAS